MSQFAEATSSAGTIDSLEKLEATPQGRRDRWIDEISMAEKELKKFHEAARRTVRKFLDDRDAVETGNKWFNIFNTNVNIMEASLYANIPTVDVSRKFNDMDDDVARVAGIILQRAIQQDMSEPGCDFDLVMKQAVSDRLIPGLGSAWLRLCTETEIQEGEDGQPLLSDAEPPEPLERIASQEVAIDYVYWEDFLWSPCRVWAERRWVGRRVPMTRDQLIKRFGKEKASEIPMDYSPSHLEADAMTPKQMVMKRAAIYEIWDRETRTVLWISKGAKNILDEKPDPLGLRDGRFEPCPMPLFANITTSNCRPKPDYAMLQDQYTELDNVNNRISLLVIACKVVGVYDRSADGIQRMLTEGYDNILIPVDNWAMFAEKGGVKGQVDWLPLESVVTALGQLTTHREIIKQQIYELTGISDIVRGSSKASETLGAQELKSKFASVRIQRLQDEVTRFAEEILTIKADILCVHFEPGILAEMSNIERTPDLPLAIPALQLLKGDEERLDWRITIQSDAMAQIDYARQKTERSEFMMAVATFLQSASTVGQGAPQLIPLMLELLKFGVAGFRVSREVEGIFDRYIKEFTDSLEQQKNAPPPPDPEMEKMQAEMQLKQQEMAMKQQADQAKVAADLQAKQQEMQMEHQRFLMEMQHEREKFQQEMQQTMQEFALSMRQSAAEAAQKREQAAADSAQQRAINAEKAEESEDESA